LKSIEDFSITINFLEWFIGFVEAEGCFYVRFSEGCASSMRLFAAHRKPTGFRITNQKLTITQTDIHGERKILKDIKNLFQNKGYLYLAKSPNCFRIDKNNLKCLQIVVEYFQHFGLKGKKHIAYFRWWRIYLMRLDNVHLLEANQKNYSVFATI